ncbi:MULTISPECIES: DUF2490 domain-containing protein [unclassified Sphingobium]|uniref:DUF2490 domain-containing protein n=1 Tax=unclassified Sphingobium TaxID=2611147 RepID=UPI000D17516D|nr:MULTISPECIES: DUF2490 domain-containing protein [unclassified Sphingobium]MBG6119401.1 hypothetical protein [Sphingobium sp. JAI105]PSO10965.1 DUF2490 domain-containing protein [Sphingobium sp. AEW4]TWD04770.1 uncharacterized protein DUF2490 [Sphingobium sp. AEW010]TWD22178.1 uncharacterized protein DUF2490 [Sphingobium sp. AEW013]TWD24667.1 uncharacterized protein DUF2490 [Sphingobium sp. AEW001]
MRRHLPLSLLAGVLPVIAMLSPAVAATQESQMWITEMATIHASKDDLVTIDASQRARSDTGSGGEQFLARIALDHRISPAVQVGGAIAYLKSEVDQELRFHQQVTLSKGIWQARTRMEERFFDNVDTASWRLRQRLQASVPLDRAKQWTMIAVTEFFFHLNRARPSDRTGLAVMRQQIGLRHPIGKNLDAQLLYMRQQTFREARPDVVAHIPWLTLSWRI